MNPPTFIQRHYSRTAGESPLGHLMAVALGMILVVVGTLLIAYVVWIPAGVVVGIAGLLVLMGGVWGHISRPLNLADLADSMVKLTGLAIALAFGLAVMAAAAGLLITVLISSIRWLAN